MTKWVRNNNGILIPNREAGFIQPGIGLMNKKHGSGGPVYFDPSKKGTNIVLSNNNKTASSTSGGVWQSVFGLSSRTVGTNLYFECLFTTTGSPFSYFAIGNSSSPINSYCGSDNNGWGLGANNTLYHGGANRGAWATVGSNQVVGIALSSMGVVYGAVNNSWAGGGSPGSGATALFTGLLGVVFPIVSIYSSGVTVTMRMTTTDFSYSPPIGYSSWE